MAIPILLRRAFTKRSIVRPVRAFIPLAIGAGTAGYLLAPRTVYADELSLRKKPIYDPRTSISPPDTSLAPSEPTRPTPTDRLTEKIRFVRVHINALYAHLNNRLNNTLDTYLTYENRFLSTLHSLLPPPTSTEQPLPGLIYLSVLTLSSTILVRRRAWPIRVVTPVTTAIVGGWYIIPETWGNIANLIWEWEGKVPELQGKHEEVRRTVKESLEEVRKGWEEARRKVEEGVREGRETVEGWVRKG